MALQNIFSGVWRSRYTYPSSSRKDDFTSEQLVVAYQKGNKLVFESVKGNDSYLAVRLSIDHQDDVATGTWQESTSPEGHYKGSVYHGAIQLIIDEDKHQLRGKWLGFGKDHEINVGPWEFTYVGDDDTDVRSSRAE